MEHRQWMDALSNIRALRREHQFDEALALVERLLREGPSSTELLVYRAQLLQLAPHSAHVADARDPLATAEESLAQACALAPNTIEPRIEMGHFLYAVRNRTTDALSQFEDAERLARDGLKEALIGKIKCLAELGRAGEVQAELVDAVHLFPDDTDLGVLQAELEGDDGET